MILRILSHCRPHRRRHRSSRWRRHLPRRKRFQLHHGVCLISLHAFSPFTTAPSPYLSCFLYVCAFNKNFPRAFTFGRVLVHHQPLCKFWSEHIFEYTRESLCCWMYLIREQMQIIHVDLCKMMKSLPLTSSYSLSNARKHTHNTSTSPFIHTTPAYKDKLRDWHSKTTNSTNEQKKTPDGNARNVSQWQQSKCCHEKNAKRKEADQLTQNFNRMSNFPGLHCRYLTNIITGILWYGVFNLQRISIHQTHPRIRRYFDGARR